MHRDVPCPEFAGAKKKCVVLAASQQQPGHGMAEILGWWPHDLTWCMENTMETLEARGVQF